MILPGSTLAVTGATGFIGTRLCQSFVHQGFAVQALVRDVNRAEALRRAGVALIHGDLSNSSALEQLLKGADAVVHAAGAVRGNCQEDFDRINVVGTRTVINALDACGSTPRLLLLSSITAREPQLSYYAHSKRESETLLAGRDPSQWVILRPPAVYGPGDVEMLPIFQAMSRGIALVPGSPQARASLIHVDDLVAAITTCLKHQNAGGNTLCLDDGAPCGYSWVEIATIAAAVYRRKVRVWQVPTRPLNWIAEINRHWADFRGSAPMLTPAKLRELRHPDWVANNSRITEITGWEPKIDLRSGLEALKISAL
ncbi:MAG: NAD-dependent epimerase/dehydratase family protein [Pseudomonadota bacterium]